MCTSVTTNSVRALVTSVWTCAVQCVCFGCAQWWPWPWLSARTKAFALQFRRIRTHVYVCLRAAIALHHMVKKYIYCNLELPTNFFLHVTYCLFNLHFNVICCLGWNPRLCLDTSSFFSTSHPMISCNRKIRTPPPSSHPPPAVPPLARTHLAKLCMITCECVCSCMFSLKTIPM